jgi:Domain of unknown function (DUF4280)
MPACAVTGAVLLCTFGTAPASLNAIQPTVLVEGRPLADITMTAMGANVPPFAMCTSLSNPTVAAATSAALGVLTPMPCTPAIIGPWRPQAPTVVVGGKPVLTFGSGCVCAFGGQISMTSPGAMRTSAG